MYKYRKWEEREMYWYCGLDLARLERLVCFLQILPVICKKYTDNVFVGKRYTSFVNPELQKYIHQECIFGRRPDDGCKTRDAWQCPA
jgi:hypothetical protein